MKRSASILALVVFCASMVLTAAWPANADGAAPVIYLPIAVRAQATATSQPATVAPQPTWTPTPQPTMSPAPTTPSQPPNPPGGIPWCPGSTGTTRVGAICNDGTSSTATGSGACSRHGGVACWIGR